MSLMGVEGNCVLESNGPLSNDLYKFFWGRPPSAFCDGTNWKAQIRKGRGSTSSPSQVKVWSVLDS